MTQFLSSNLSLVVGALLLLVVVGIRVLTHDRDLMSDLRFAFFSMVAFLALRVTAFFVGPLLTGMPANLLRLAWMLTFAFGAIRFVVGVGLWALRARRRTPTPKILRDFISFTLYALASLPILKATLKIDLAGLVATSAILSVMLGFAMQETLGNLFAGLALQLERPFEVGDVVVVDQHTGKIAQVGWRATRIETFRNESITLPNNIIAKAGVKNFSRGGGPIGADMLLGLAYDVPPNRVKGAVLDTLREIPECLAEPAPTCRTVDFAESAVQYQVRFFARDFDTVSGVKEQLYTRLWYRFQQEGIEIPFPQRVLHMRQAASGPTQDTQELLGLLTSVDILALLKPEELRVLASEVLPRRFGAGERVITEGDHGNTFYVVASGEVSVRSGRPEVEVSRLGRGQYFGEMSLLTGAPRSATVVATQDTLLLEIGRPIFARVLASNPPLAKALAELLAQRRTELRAVAGTSPAEARAPEARRIFARLREIFALSEA